MENKELVNKLIEYINAGKNVQAEEELYADHVVSYEQDGRSASGKEAIIAKTKAAASWAEEFYGANVENAYVGKDSALLEIKMDFKPKGGERTQMSEFGFYKLADGKVVEEHFYAQPLAST